MSRRGSQNHAQILKPSPFVTDSLGASIDLNMRVKVYGEKNVFFSQFQNPIAAQVLSKLLAIARQLALQLSCCKPHGETGKAGRGYCWLPCPGVLGTKSGLYLFLRSAVWGGSLSPRSSWSLRTRECFTLGFLWWQVHSTESILPAPILSLLCHSAHGRFMCWFYHG